MKTCPRCGETKEEEEFSWKNRLLGRRQKLCKDCLKQEQHEYYERNKERIRGNII